MPCRSITRPSRVKKAEELGTAPLPLETNTSEEYFAGEREKLFKRVWLNVGRDEDIPNPGDYFVKDLPILETSLLVVRGTDGRVRAFHNMCRHRGNKVVKSCGGTSKGFQCGFHGWTYDLEGELVHVPDEGQFPSFFCKADYGLAAVATDTWEGFIFVNVDREPRQTLREYFGEMWGQYRGFPFGAMPRVARWRAEVKVNWKVFEDAFLEGYHVAFVHKRSLPDALTGEENPFCHQPATRFFGPHRSNTALSNMKHRMTPAEELAFKAGYSLVSQADVMKAMMEALPAGLNPERHLDWAFDNCNIFPNFWMFIGMGWYFTYNFWPLAVDRTFYEVNYYAPPAPNASVRIGQEYARVMLRDALREDLSTQESTQEMQRTGAMTHMILSAQELMVREHRHWIEKYLQAA